MKPPYTHDEIAEMIRKLDVSIERTEGERPNVRPLPPMTSDESHDAILAFTEAATTRLLTQDEAFLVGQLMANYRMAIRAEMLGRKGRYICLSEDDIARVTAKMEGGQ